MTTLSLNAIIAKDAATLSELERVMYSQGWVFVELPDELSSLADEANDVLKSFYDQGRDRWNFRQGYMGFSQFDGKDVFRFATGSEMSSASCKIFPENFGPVKELSGKLDDLLLQVTQSTCERIFGQTFEQFVDNHSDSLPLLRSADDERSRFALFDSARYYARTTAGGKDCAAHYDPGLYTLSVLSSSAGLQLRDEAGRWIAGPLGSKVGLLWAGYAAKELSGGRVTPAMHKVELPAGSTDIRMTIWSELATQEQILPASNRIMMAGPNAKFQFESATMLLVPNLAEPYRVPIVKGNVMKAMETAQTLLGLPISKIMRQVVYNEKGEVEGFK